jgi:hypothetical protein
MSLKVVNFGLMKEMIKHAQSLLSQVSALKKKHKEIAQITGKKFNIFSILGAESTETSTHSSFLAELLNPEGSHGQKGLFLKLFMEILVDEERSPKIPKERIPVIDEIDSATVDKEKHLGAIRNEKSEGGFADIVINHSKNAICIENKIYAKDQEKQLIRYHNYYVNGEKGGLLLYLTLWGNGASSFSTTSESPKISLTKNEDYFTISYKKEILSWLVKCQSESIDVPTVREAIGQYIYLIKKLTGTGMGTLEKKDFIKLITELEKSHGQDDLIALREAFDVFLEEIERKLNVVDKGLSSWEYRTSSTIWKDPVRQKKLLFVLVVNLEEVHGIKDVGLKIRLSAKGWSIELWNIKGLNLVGAVKTGNGDNDQEYATYLDHLDFHTKESDIVVAAKKAVSALILQEDK